MGSEGTESGYPMTIDCLEEEFLTRRYNLNAEASPMEPEGHMLTRMRTKRALAPVGV